MEGQQALLFFTPRARDSSRRSVRSILSALPQPEHQSLLPSDCTLAKVRHTLLPRCRVQTHPPRLNASISSSVNADPFRFSARTTSG